MATTKITDLTAYTDPVNTDVLPIVDVTSDVTKKVSIANVMKNASLGSAAAPGISFDGDPNTGIYSPGANQVAISTDGTARLTAGTTAITAAIPVDVLLGSASTPSYTFTGDLNTGIYSPGADQVAISTNGQGRLFVNSGGNVGVGAAAPDNLFHINQSATSGFNQVIQRITTAAGGSFFIRCSDLSAAAPSWEIYTGSSEDIRFSPGAVEKLRITSTGELKHIGGGSEGSPAVYFAGSAPSNSLYVQATTGRVGLGTTSPDGELDVTGTGDANGGVLVVNDAGVIGIEVVSPQPTILLNETDTTDENYQVRLDSGDLLIQTQTDARTGASTKVVIDSSGKVGVGTTTPLTKFVASNGGAEGIELAPAYSSGNNFTFHVNRSGSAYVTNSQVASAHIFRISSDSTEAARIDSSGRLLVGTSTTIGNNYWGNGQIQLANDNGAVIQAYTFRNNSTNGAAIDLHKARGTQASPLNPGVTDILGEINFYGYNSSAATPFQRAAYINCRVDGTPGQTTTDMPGELNFATSPDGSATPEVRLHINNLGNVGIGTTSPGQALHVVGKGRFQEAASSGAIAFIGGDATAAYIDTGTYATVQPLAFRVQGTEYLRIDSSGRLLVGTSTARSVGGLTNQVQVEGVNAGTYSQSWVRNVAGTGGATIYLGKTRSASNGGVTIVNNNDQLGALHFAGADGVDLDTLGASIEAYVDGSSGANSMPGRIIFSTATNASPSVLTERMRITNDGVFGYNQPAPVAVDTTATLTVANLKTGIITSTTAAAVTMTLPTGTLTEGGFAANSLYNNFTFEWTVINTGATNAVTVQGDTGHTLVGSGTVAAGVSGRFASRRTAANTFVTYRLS